MKRKLLILTVIGLFLLPTYAAANSCCGGGAAEKQQTQTQNTGPKNQTGCPAMAGKTASGAAPQTPGACPIKAQGQSTAKSSDSEKEKK